MINNLFARITEHNNKEHSRAGLPEQLEYVQQLEQLTARGWLRVTPSEIALVAAAVPAGEATEEEAAVAETNSYYSWLRVQPQRASVGRVRTLLRRVPRVLISASDSDGSSGPPISIATVFPCLRSLALADVNVSSVAVCAPLLLDTLIIEHCLADAHGKDLLLCHMGGAIVDTLSKSHMGGAIVEQPSNTRMESIPDFDFNHLFSRIALLHNALSSISLLLPLLRYVHILDLTGNALSTFPSDLVACPNLKSLNLSMNKISCFGVRNSDYQNIGVQNNPDDRDIHSEKSDSNSAVRDDSNPDSQSPNTHSLHTDTQPTNYSQSSQSLQQPSIISKPPTTDPPIAFNSLLHLSLSSNCIEVIEPNLHITFPALKTLDLSLNNILDVFQFKHLGLFETLEELKVAGNPIAKNDFHRTTIFTYFKAQNLTLKIDSTSPSMSEKREILATLAIAVTSSSPPTTRLPHTSQISASLKKKKKKKDRRAIAVVQEGPVSATQTQALPPPQSSPLPPKSPPPPLENTPSQTTPLQYHTHPHQDHSDLTMEPLDATSSSTTTSRADTPNAHISGFGQSSPSSVDVVQSLSAFKPHVNLTPPAHRRSDKSISKYFDAQQDFTAVMRRGSTRSIESTETSDGEDGGQRQIGKLEQENIDVVVNTAKNKVESLSPKMRGDVGLIFIGDGNGVKEEKHGVSGKPSFPRMHALGVTQTDIVVDSLSSSPTSSPFVFNSFENSTPIANTPSQPRKPITTTTATATKTPTVNASPTTPTIPLLSHQTAKNLRAKMAQAHEQTKRESQLVVNSLDSTTIATTTITTPAVAAAATTDFPTTTPTTPPRDVGLPRSEFEQAAVGAGNLTASSTGSGSGLSSLKGFGGRGGRGVGYRGIYAVESGAVVQGHVDVESVRSMRPVVVSYVDAVTGGGTATTTTTAAASTIGLVSETSSSPKKGAAKWRNIGQIAETVENADALASFSPPRLVLARPVASAGIYQRRGVRGVDGSEAGASEASFGGSVYAGNLTRRSTAVSRAMSVFSGGSTRFSVFSGMTRATSIAQPSNLGHNLSRGLSFPRSPNIPFLAINNSLQLHLKFNVFRNDQEKVVAWVAGSIVPQTSPYLNHIHAQPTQSATMFQTTTRETNHPVLTRMQTVERAAYLLVTNQSIYIFTPNFIMPYDPFSQNLQDPHVSNVLAQVQYDDPSRVLKLARRIPIVNILRVDVGLNRQFVGIHFLGDVDGGGGSGSNSGVNKSAGVGGIGVEGVLKRGGDVGKGAEKLWNPLNGVRSLVFLTRDKCATNRIVDSLVAVVDDLPASTKAAGVFRFRGKNSVGVGGRLRIMNQDVEWSVKSIRDTVLLKPGASGKIVWNRVDVDGRVDWRDVVENIGRVNEEAGSGEGDAGLVKKGWLSELLTTPLIFGPGSTNTESLASINNAHTLHTSSIISDAEYDGAVAESVVVNKVTFDFLKLYVLVGWIVPHQSPASASLKTQIPKSLSVTVNSCSLIITSEFLYLTCERFDVWPPPLFPTSSHPTSTVNSALLDHAQKILAAAAAATTPTASFQSSDTQLRNSQSPAAAVAPAIDPFNGLSASKIPQYSPPLRVGRVQDLVRCERWKTWRWKISAGVSQVEEASVLEQQVAALVQNGAIGVLKVVENEWPVGGGKRSSNSIDKLRRAGNTCGWEWWIRVVFRDPSNERSSGSATRESIEAHLEPEPPQDHHQEIRAQEYFWDLVFSTLDSANEFLEAVKKVRGVKPAHATEEMQHLGFEAVHHHTHHQQQQHDAMEGVGVTNGDDFEDTEIGRDAGFFENVVWDGVELVIGDD